MSHLLLVGVRVLRCLGCRFGDRAFAVSNIPYPDYFGEKAMGKYTVATVMQCMTVGDCPASLVPSAAALANGSTPFYIFERLFLNMIAPEIGEDFPKVRLRACGTCDLCPVHHLTSTGAVGFQAATRDATGKHAAPVLHRSRWLRCSRAFSW
jgi:hypothetical protein